MKEREEAAYSESNSVKQRSHDKAAADEERDSKRLAEDEAELENSEDIRKPSPSKSSAEAEEKKPKEKTAHSIVASSKRNNSVPVEAPVSPNPRFQPGVVPIDKSSKDGKLIFLFLLGGGLPHASIWQQFFQRAPRKQFLSFMHCSESSKCLTPAVEKAIPGIRQVHTVPTYYCHDLVTAMVHLMKSAILHDPQGSDQDRFVFISESTLPLKPFNQVRSTLLADHGSDLCIFPKDHWGTTEISSSGVPEASALRGGGSRKDSTAYLVKHHQWVILTRKHGEKMARDWVPVNSEGHWEVPLSGKMKRMVSVNAFARTAEANYCTDEWAFFATIFGAIATPPGDTVAVPELAGGPLSVGGNATKDVQGKCYTYAFFESAGPYFSELAAEIAGDRKDGTKLSCYPHCWQHPMEMQAVSTSALHALRKSSFLFARKFPPNFSIIGSSYAEVIFSQRA